ncbi:PREDICTED: PHD finger protein 21A isoform X2 [Nicrophorus vespilloides]|uniref:PHD finger protein 21A isoform X2 n=1 Tax=Nicrophorus vespilloides TaxID=110193 RepID=A0ABM1M4W2_NICVS|nr:PREDICTED: PHD finger protein 21A isoform X2 [Nicrophorus vespilloides]
MRNTLNAEISRELRSLLEKNQSQLKKGIKQHQTLLSKLKDIKDPHENKEVQILIEETRQEIVNVGLEQKDLVDRLRKEYKTIQRNAKAATVKNGLEERRLNLTSALNRARKQDIIKRSTSQQSASPSEESELQSGPSSPEPCAPNPINPQDISQTDFLTYFGLATHDVFKEIQNKRAERKRRRTANPQFLYTKGWDISKRKRNMYLANASPPNTRQSVKNKARGSSPTFKQSRPSSPVDKKLSIPNLPSGLTIERITQARSTADTKTCIECRLGGYLVICEFCTNGFHISCHNRPLVQQPKHCPKCYKDMKNSAIAANAELNVEGKTRSSRKK